MSGVIMAIPVGERFARAIAAKDAPGLLELLASDIDFGGMTPGRFWEATSADELVNDVIFGRWFSTTDHIEAIEAVDRDVVVDRERVGYRLRVKNDDGEFLVEQQAYFAVADDRIAWLRIMCSGYRPVAS
jgi:hypothetical protein